MSSYTELLEQRDKLEKQIQKAKEQEIATILEDIKQKMVVYGITAADLGAGQTKYKKRERRSVQPKYRDPSTGSTWSGRGKPPKWIAGKNREQYLIQN